MNNPPPSDPDEKNLLLYCSFCGNNQHETGLIIAGPSVFICCRCVASCVRVISENIQKERAKPKNLTLSEPDK